jgi:S-adenosylmethionine:tRNA ribosyltransferase-isomerase
MRLADFDFPLPDELIAQRPAERRDASRLLVVGDELGDRAFAELPELLPADALLIVNDARVIPARLFARRDSGGRHEVFLVEPDAEPGVFRALVRGQVKDGQTLTVEDRSGRRGPELVFLGRDDDGTARVRLPSHGLAALTGFGELPLPPYIARPEGTTAEDDERYQTVYAETPGAVAAPTAGLHFTPEILARLAAKGIERAAVTLHVGLGTFAPVRVDDLDQHVMHEERFEVPAATAAAYARARHEGRPVIAVGTTCVRVLESVAEGQGETLRSGPGRTRLFIQPGFRFRAVDRLITNFHLPKSTLLVLVSAFAGRERVLAAYQHAVSRRYRFFSFGDAMLLSRAP